MRLGLLISCCFFISCQYANAQTCCSGGVPVSNNIGFENKGKSILQFGLSYDLNELSTLLNEDQELMDNLRKRRTQTLLIRSGYSLTKRLSIEAMFSFVKQDRKIYTNQGNTDQESSLGIGDPVLLTSYQIFRKPLDFSIGLGVQVPLGSYTKRNSQGLFLVEDLQPGSGAWDLILFHSLVYAFHFRPNLSVYTRTLYSIQGTNSNSRNGLQSYRFGNDFQFIFGLNDQILFLNRIVNPGISIRYRSTQRDQIDGIPNSGTGGRWLFGRTSFGVEMPWASQIQVQFEWPLHAFVNETQLSPDFMVNLSWYKSLNSAKTEDFTLKL
jgi:hypothetical protein